MPGRPNEELIDALAQARTKASPTARAVRHAAAAVAAVKDGRADALMKGSVDTSTFMQAVLDREKGLRSGNLLSHVAVLEALGRLLLITDGGIVLNPTLEEKAKIIANAVAIASGPGDRDAEGRGAGGSGKRKPEDAGDRRRRGLVADESAGLRGAGAAGGRQRRLARGGRGQGNRRPGGRAGRHPAGARRCWWGISSPRG